MKSSIEDLKLRGYLPENEHTMQHYTLNECIDLLYDFIPQNRTLGARLIKNFDSNSTIVENLITALKKEKKLYTKIELTESLKYIGKASIQPLIATLGTIGTNQHKEIPTKPFNKDNYPLPRDISARTLAHMGPLALKDLLNFISCAKDYQLSEALDAIGFICFYNSNKNVFEKIFPLYSKASDLIKWKLIRCFSSFPESLTFLNTLKLTNKNPLLVNEIERSIRLILKK